MHLSRLTDRRTENSPQGRRSYRCMDKKNQKSDMEFDYSTISKFMQEHGKFCLWKLEMKSGKGKPDKIPYQLNGKRADATNPQHYASFEEIVEVFAKGGYAGVGVGCFKPLRLVDVDDCVVDRMLDERGQDIMDTLDSYTELSPSSNGIHIFVLADGFSYDTEKYYINNRNTHVEVYSPDVTGKFLTLTGKAIHGTDVNERSKELQTVLEKYMKRPNAEATDSTVAAPGSYLSDESVYTKASKSKQGEKFNALWNGEIPDGKSPSEADMALAEILAFWCGGDTEQMDRLFRRSGLLRNKWDRVQSGSTYGMLTLTKAVKKCTAFYSPMLATAEEDFNDILQKLTEFNLLENKRYRSGDIGYGRLFADVFKEIARYMSERKKWFVYDGKRWVPDIANLKIMELGKDLADAMLLYTSTIKDEEKRLHFLKESKYWQQRRFRETYIKEAQSVYPVPMERFDSNRYLFNCNNVTFDLRTCIPKEHSPDDFLTKISPVDYDPNAKSERFDRFIDEVMSADKDKVLFLQKALGYGICGDTRYECMFFLYGETTRNGKGTLMESVLKVLGDYGKAVRPETIAQKHNVNSQAPSEDIARLAGIRFANIAEPSRGLMLNAAQIKNMTGNDTLNARFLNENSFDFESQSKLYINTNYFPVISDMTIIAGYRILQEEEFKQPSSVTAAISAYQYESDKLAQFAEERLMANASK